MLKQFPSDNINVTKNILSFLSRAPTHRSFTFNSQLSSELKHKVHLCKTASGIFHFQFYLVFIKVYIFVQQKAWTLWLNFFFKTKIIEKPHTVLLSEPWFLSCNQKFETSMRSASVRAPKNLTWRRTFKA